MIILNSAFFLIESTRYEFIVMVNQSECGQHKVFRYVYILTNNVVFKKDMAIRWWTWCTGGRGCRCWTGTRTTAQGARPPADGDDGGDGGGTAASPCRRMFPPTRCSHVPRPQRLPSPPPTYTNGKHDVK